MFILEIQEEYLYLMQNKKKYRIFIRHQNGSEVFRTDWYTGVRAKQSALKMVNHYLKHLKQSKFAGITYLN